MEKHFKVVDLSQKRNAYTVGDIHGRFDLLEQELKKIGFDKKQDALFVPGDLIDRGRYSNQVVSYLNADWLYASAGNHEKMAIDGAFDGYLANLHAKEGGKWFYDLSEDERYIVARELIQLPIAIETIYKGKKYGFVHADVAGDDWDEFTKAIRECDPNTSPIRNVIGHAIWNRSRPRDWFTGFNHENHQPIKNVDKVFVGHNVFQEPLAIHNINYIDTGAYYTNNLTVVPLDVQITQAPEFHEVYSTQKFWEWG